MASLVPTLTCTSLFGCRKKQGQSVTYTTMSSICPTSLLRRLVHLDVLDDQIPSIQTLGVRVGFSVLE